MISVLLVDDHPVVRAGYQRLLDQDGGVQVLAEADSAHSGLAAFVACRPDVTITDLSMPGTDGMGLLAQLLAHQPTAKVLVCSMYDTPHVVHKALTNGACGFVSKNASPDNLVDAVYAAHRGATYLSDGLVARHAQTGEEQARLSSLTPREHDILCLLAQGYNAAQCAERLTLSLKTVANNQTLIKDKLGVNTTAALVLLAQRHGIITLSPTSHLTP